MKKVITEKSPKQAMINALRSAEVTDKSLKSMVEKTLAAFDKDMTSVKKADLFNLYAKVTAEPAEEQEQMTIEAPKENSLKPKKSGKKSKKTPEKVVEIAEAPAEEEEETTPEPEKEEKPKKTSKKKGGITKVKTEKKEEEVIQTSTPATNVGSDFLPCAKIFPKEINHPDLGKLTACTGEYTKYSDLYDALVKDEKTLYFACYWTKRQIKEYQYAAYKQIDPKTVKNGFPLDLDILMAVLPCETMERIYAMSRMTEALFQFEGEDFDYVEDTDPATGDKFRVRVSAGMEFEIYRPEEEEEK